MTIFGGDAVQQDVAAALEAVEHGEPTPERRHYDFKEEAGRRDRHGTIHPGAAHNEKAARGLAVEVACMANTPGGGALIVGVADDRTVVGASVDLDWLQMRLYQLLQRKITTVITEHLVQGQRVLVVRCPPAVEPIAWAGKITWRVGDQCQEIDAASWHERRAQGWSYDWSARSSDVPMDAVRPEAVAIARQFLRDSGDARAEDLADATTTDLLRRLAVVTSAGYLTYAGAIAFVGRTTPALDYIRRPAPGADSEARVNVGTRSLLQELAEVFATARAYNPETHVEQGLVIARLRSLPERALREAIVNGIAHREWTDPAATFVEHVGATLRVTSPGGFYGGVRADNIINHPPKSRNTSLSSVLAALRIAESQGIGVDRMFGDMVRLGHPLPTIAELDGNRVLAVLAGERPDTAWMRWLRRITPEVGQDLRLLMSLHRLVERRWTDAEDLTPYLQVTHAEAIQVVDRMRDLTIGNRPVAFDVEGVPPAREGVVLGLTDPAWDELSTLSRESGHRREEPSRDAVALSYARHAGRISTTELASIIGAHATNVGTVLRRLEDDGSLSPSRATRRGAGFFYRYVPTSAETRT